MKPTAKPDSPQQAADDVPASVPTPNRAGIRARLQQTTASLQALAASREWLDELTVDERTALLTAAGEVFCADPILRRAQVKARRRQNHHKRVAHDEALLTGTGIRMQRSKPVFTTPDAYAPKGFSQADVSDPLFRETVQEQHCYICKKHYKKVHHFYDQLCPDCGAFNFAKRTELADLGGKVVLLTGGRVKIGYQAGIKLLRCGADLIVVTRFPRDAAARYAAEPDFLQWGHRLEVFGLDLRHTPSVEAFCHHIDTTRNRLDFIINNACQTVRRPPDFYRHMMDSETAALQSLSPEVLKLVGAYEGLRGYHILPTADNDITSLPTALSNPAGVAGLARAAELSQTPLLPEEVVLQNAGQHDLFPIGQLDKDMQQVDLRDRNSWRLLLHEVSSVELLETQLVNAVAPFVLNARLKSLMERTPRDSTAPHQHIVNVSAVEGQFYRRNKTTRHPHTNMAKAALNMMTRTSATDYFDSGIHMNSVDTGWVSDEDPVEIAIRKTAEQRFHPPLDIVDGAARIVDPLIAGANTGNHIWGEFLKDYTPTEW